jgi:hypothetical protein
MAASCADAAPADMMPLRAEDALFPHAQNARPAGSPRTMWTSWPTNSPGPSGTSAPLYPAHGRHDFIARSPGGARGSP